MGTFRPKLFVAKAYQTPSTLIIEGSGKFSPNTGPATDRFSIAADNVVGSVNARAVTIARALKIEESMVARVLGKLSQSVTVSSMKSTCFIQRKIS